MAPLELRMEILEAHDQLDTLDIIKETNQYNQYMKIQLIHIKWHMMLEPKELNQE